MGDRVWWTRLRWRLRGATMWPAFAVALVGDAVLLRLLPIAGDTAPDPFAALLLALFFNLVVVAVGAPLGGRWLRRGHPALPKVIADDRAGTALVGAVSVALLAAGLAHRPAVLAEAREFDEQAATARQFVLERAPARFRAHLEDMDTLKQAGDLYRTCVPGPSARRAFCVIVNTDQHPPGVTRDADQSPNAALIGTGELRVR
ncbi:MAG: hypothetical protein QOD81_1727 [Solirubrobacteraceae bacterium]|jgi:hypothetical protein|nr:hypothetical protein [Solirubrobacteraceae bacterium]